ncbi:MAG: hypothetical protein U9R66_11495 [Thermodesulfobacteriota bacterium]|nr:hypothetical protein [Thermodesulfobacteriota bacterium]
MAEFSVQLPGGFLHENRIHRQAVFRPICGETELFFQESNRKKDSISSYVTGILAAALDKIGGIHANPSVVGQLCVADRQYLMLQLASMLEGNLFWILSSCSSCKNDFDICVKRSDLPVKGAGHGYPFATVKLDGAELTCRIPVGEDQEKIEHLADDDALHLLLEHCIEGVNGEEVEKSFVDSLTPADIGRIEDVLEDISPSVTTSLLTRCPECDAEQVIELDPYKLPVTETGNFYQEIHTLATAYHWSEQDIMALPRSRRRIYLDLIDQSRGMYG